MMGIVVFLVLSAAPIGLGAFAHEIGEWWAYAGALGIWAGFSLFLAYMLGD